MNSEEKENWADVHYRMNEEIDDEEFHRLRLQYIKSAKELENYIKNKYKESLY